MLRLLLLFVMIFCQTGCHKESIPVLPPIARITATLHPLPDLKIPGIDLVDVPESELSTIAILITPVSPCSEEEGILLYPKIYRHIADVVVEHKDGSKSNLIVRWTGKNPALFVGSFPSQPFKFRDSAPRTSERRPLCSPSNLRDGEQTVVHVQ